MTTVFKLADEPPRSEVGGKFYNLARASRQFLVPRSICLGVDAFEGALRTVQPSVNRVFEDLNATIGCCIPDSMGKLADVLKELRVTPELRAQLKAALRSEWGEFEEQRFAVRSSAVNEDSSTHCFAGVYHTSLSVSGMDAIVGAIEDCWKSYYSYAAVVARLRIGNCAAEGQMAVIVQTMIDAKFSGVALSEVNGGQDTVVEYVAGRGDRLVSGVCTPSRTSKRDDRLNQRPEQEMLGRVFAATDELRDFFGWPIDLEWAWDGTRLFVLQARPVTASCRKSGPFYCVASLYGDASLPSEIELGACTDVYKTYATKRGPAYRLALSSGVQTGAAHILSYNGEGFWKHRDRFEQLLASSAAPRVVVDLGTDLRQLILDKSQLFSSLCEIHSLEPSGSLPHTIILRDFVEGQYGFVSQLLEDGRLLIEYSREGLLSLNRGLGVSHRLLVEHGQVNAWQQSPGMEGDPELKISGPALRTVFDFTTAIQELIPGVQLEWVLEQSTPYFVDFSSVASQPMITEASSTLCISPGVARGPVLSLDHYHDLLEQLSIGPAVSIGHGSTALTHRGLQAIASDIARCSSPPIICVARPYAILSVFFEAVAGFVFAEGSLLCHLALMLREGGIPAAVGAGVDCFPNNELLLMDGAVSVITPTEDVHT